MPTSPVDTEVPEADPRRRCGRAATRRARAQIPLTDAYWRERAIPELRAHYGWVAAAPVEAMPADELAAAWDEAWARIGRCWSIHFYAIRGPYQVLDDLADLYESVVPDAPPGEALGLIGGGVHELHDVERQLEALAALRPQRPRSPTRFAAAAPTASELAARPEAAAFMTGLDAFLAEHGHLGQGFDDLAMPSWAEEPDLLLTELAKAVEHPPPSAPRSVATAGGEAEALAAASGARWPTTRNASRDSRRCSGSRARSGR